LSRRGLVAAIGCARSRAAHRRLACAGRSKGSHSMQKPNARRASLVAAATSVLAASGAHAQTPPAATSAAPLPPVFVTATPLGSSLFELVDPVNVLEGQGLRLRRQPTLGQTVDQEVGVSATYFGPNASRPIIRGLGGFDIRLLNNGIGILDASASSPDHAVAVSPFATDRIEIVRGPATVMYGGTAIGGVVNTIDSRIAETGLARPVSGAASYQFDSQNNLNAGGARLDAGNERFVLHGDVYKTNNHDLRIPGDAWSPQVQAARGEPGPFGRLPNSQGDSESYGIGASAILGERGFLGVSYGEFKSNYGTVAEPDVTIKLKQDTWNVAGELRDTIPGLQALRVKYAYTDYTHTEFDGQEPGTVFDSKGWNLRVEALHRKLGPFQGAIGLELVDFDFSAQGEEAFVPSTKTKSVAGFLYEELPYESWKFSFGARVADTKVDADEFAAAGLPAASRSFTPWSGAVGAFYAFNREWGLGANVQYTQRAPSFQELYADGPHLATNQFEVGNAALNKVESTSIDVTLRQQSGQTSSTVNAFYSGFSNFIGLFPTGIYRNPEDRSVVPDATPIVDPNTGEEIVPLEQFDYAQVKARFYGVEAQTTFPVWRQAGNVVTLKLQADYVNATDRTNGQPLPFIPPFRVGATLGFQRDGFRASLGGLFAAAQNRVPDLQTTTPGYANVFANASYLWKLPDGVSLEAFLQGTNLLDQTIRYSTSNLKDIAPLGRAAVMVGLRGAF
jgi:iron complex outermembrane receptor protein